MRATLWRMSLIAFHRFLIGSAIVFCGGFSAWEFRAYAAGGGTGALVLGWVFVLLTLGLIYYLWHLRRFLGHKDQ